MLKLFIWFIILSLKDMVTGKHSIRVAFKMVKYANMLRDTYNLSFLKAFLYGLFHDIGKLAIPNKILKKRGLLTSEEFEIIKTHTTNKYALYSEKYFPGICDHHETMIGNGYSGKTSEDINIYAKLLSIADVYDALRNKRHYKDSMERERVLEIMNTMVHSGKFDILIYEKVIRVA